jgi:hypothetical protein
VIIYQIPGELLSAMLERINSQDGEAGIIRSVHKVALLSNQNLTLKNQRRRLATVRTLPRLVYADKNFLDVMHLYLGLLL